MFYSFRVRIVKIQCQFLFQEILVLLILVLYLWYDGRKGFQVVKLCPFPSYSQNLHQQLGHVVNAKELVKVQDNRDLASRYCIDFSKS